MKNVIIISVILILISVLLNRELFSSTITQDYRRYRPVENLVTAFMTFPLVQYRTEYLKRDKATLAFLMKEKTAVTGYCLRYYDISVGYDLSADLCDRQHILPTPQILSINTLSSEVLGKFSRQECDTLDHRGKLLEQVPAELIAQSQKTLSRFLRLICPDGLWAAARH